VSIKGNVADRGPTDGFVLDISMPRRIEELDGPSRRSTRSRSRSSQRCLAAPAAAKQGLRR